MQVQLATKISIETAQALDAQAKATGKSKASIVEKALREFMKLAPTEAK